MEGDVKMNVGDLGCKVDGFNIESFKVGLWY
jgi:hypothetical protein